MTRIAAVALACLLAAALPSTPAAAAGSAPIVVRGAGGTFSDVRLTESVDLSDVVTFSQSENATDIGASSGGRYVGYYVLSLPDLQPVAGAVEIEAFSGKLGRTATSRIGPDTTRLEPGRYRFIMFADGNGEARIGTESLAAPLEVTTTVPHPTVGAQFAEVTSSGVTPTAGPPVDFRLERDGVYVVAAQTTKTSAVGSTKFCVVRRDAGTCQPDSGAGPGVSAGSTFTFPVDGVNLKPGVYRTVWESSGDQQVTYLALSVGPGPRQPPVLPVPAQPTFRTDPQPRDRNLLDVCPTGSTGPAFSDTTGTVHQEAADCLAALGVARGSNGSFGPTAPVTRGQLASFLDRALQRAGVAPTGSGPQFSDTGDSVHRGAIARVAALGITQGFADGTFRPTQPVARDQTASFLHRAYAVAAGLPLDRTTDAFADDQDNTHETNIDALAANGIVSGTSSITFAPDVTVRRGQMASLVARTLDLLAEVGRVQPAGNDN